MTRWGIQILDIHAHFPHPADDYWGWWGRSYRQRWGEAKYALLRQRQLAAQQEWWRRWSFPVPEEVTVEEATRRWIGEVDRYGLEGIVFVTGGGNGALAEVCRQDRRLIGFAHHDPFDPDAAGELSRAVLEQGLRGFKILGPALDRGVDDPELVPLWEACETLGIPVLVHFGPYLGGGGIAAGPNMSPLTLHTVAKAFPTVTFIVPHFGCGYPTDLLHLCWACENVCVDTSGNNEWVRWMVPPLTLEDLFRQFRETVGAGRILFGTDSSHFPRGFVARYVEEQLRACLQVGYTPAEVAQVFAGNARRALKIPEGEAKGPTDSSGRLAD
jgi:predicted TIM-barrel fold metal-dependent hydrolase